MLRGPVRAAGDQNPDDQQKGQICPHPSDRKAFPRAGNLPRARAGFFRHIGQVLMAVIHCEIKAVPL